MFLLRGICLGLYGIEEKKAGEKILDPFRFESAKSNVEKGSAAKSLDLFYVKKAKFSRGERSRRKVTRSVSFDQCLR